MYQVDAFADRIFQGNPAAVLILEDWLPEAVMQAIANENNLAETAFARPNGKRWDLRWFTPIHEAEFCGHATLATAHVLAEAYRVQGDMAFGTRVGEIRAARRQEAYQLDLPGFSPEPVEADLLQALHDSVCAQPVACFRNFENLFVELADEEAVRSFVPDLMKIAALHPLGVVVTARGNTHDFVSRYFAPGAGIPEDPVTGSIHATLVPYWFEKLGKTWLSAFQCSQRGGHLLCEFAGDRVLITGRARTFMKAEIYLPD
ncbi:PhzF family phenazine biosynthesis protein [Mesorhizobium sp. M3A.F.Ca.ET.080.04.2.1]|nr:PhzF family phenazine biosynthesis protein [Mesorhizobium sp. M3A.F.Ca.ET.080.04.2.1]RWF20267.1 MAG: PhzF family phenazine biosynthesis protein [Mesorhizobium sp.]